MLHLAPKICLMLPFDLFLMLKISNLVRTRFSKAFDTQILKTLKILKKKQSPRLICWRFQATA